MEYARSTFAFAPECGASIVDTFNRWKAKLQPEPTAAATLTGDDERLY